MRFCQYRRSNECLIIRGIKQILYLFPLYTFRIFLVRHLLAPDISCKILFTQVITVKHRTIMKSVLVSKSFNQAEVFFFFFFFFFCGGKYKVLILVIMPLLIKQFLLYKKLFVLINYHQVLNEYLLHSFLKIVFI